MSSKATHERILDRIEEGFGVPEQILNCGECGRPIFDLTVEEVKAVMDELVAEGKAEWRKQGGKTDMARGSVTEICVPWGTPWKT